MADKSNVFFKAATAPIEKQAAFCFNLYQSWFDRLDRTEVSLTFPLGGLIIRAYGSDEKKQADWDRIWRTKYPEWGPCVEGVSVSSNPPEIWCDLRVDRFSNYILPPHVLGHELLHTLKLSEPGVVDPDMLVEDIY